MDEKTKIITALFAAFLLTSLSSLYLGRTGTLAMEELQLHQQELIEHQEFLEDTQQQLKNRFEALRFNPRVVVQEARSLGLFRPGEKVMLLTGLKSQSSFSFEGALPEFQPKAGLNNETFRYIFLLSSLILYGLLTIFNLLITSKNS